MCSWAGSTAADGSGTAYAPGDEYALDGSKVDVLYAQWRDYGGDGSVTFDGNAYTTNSDGETVPDFTGNMGDVLGECGQAVILPDNADGNGFVRYGYTLAGWNTEADGTGTDYALGASFTLSADADEIPDKLYAVWAAKDVQVVYNGIFYTTGTDGQQVNDFEGDLPANATASFSGTAVVGSATSSKVGYTFRNVWTLTPIDPMVGNPLDPDTLQPAVTEYKPGDNLPITSEGPITLYGVWVEATCMLQFEANGTEDEPVSGNVPTIVIAKFSEAQTLPGVGDMHPRWL